MSYWDEQDRRREGRRDAEHSRYPSYDHDRYGSDADRAYHRAFEDRRDEIRREELREEELREEERQQERREEARREAFHDQMRLERDREQEEQEPEEEPEPVIEAIEIARHELANECAGALDEC